MTMKKITWPDDNESDDNSSVGSSSSSSASSLFADDDHALDEIQLLERSIEQRKTLLAKLLQGKEGTEHAEGIQEHEDIVNTYLLAGLKKLQSQSNVTKPPTSTVKHLNGNSQSTMQGIRHSISRELQFTLPGIISLLTHCSLYLSIYGCINKAIEWTCDKFIIHLFGWHISENAFDCTHHERIFQVVCLVMGCLLGRLTGSIWAWNENEEFQQKLRGEIKSHTSKWDIQIIRWFEGKGKRYKSRQWGRQCKLILDTISFFIAYVAVDRVLHRDFPTYAFDNRAGILEGMPSRQVDVTNTINNSEAVRRCDNLDNMNNTSEQECSNRFAEQEEFVSDVINWIENSNRCGWIEKEVNDEEGVDEGSKFRPWRQYDEEWKQQINEMDEKYLLEKVSYKTYYELIGDPSSQFVDPHLEDVYMYTSTVIGFGILTMMGAPFLLI